MSLESQIELRNARPNETTMKRLMIFLLEIRITLAHRAMNRAYAKKDMRAARARGLG